MRLLLPRLVSQACSFAAFIGINSRRLENVPVGARKLHSLDRGETDGPYRKSKLVARASRHISNTLLNSPVLSLSRTQLSLRFAALFVIGGVAEMHN
jgi:hypothetical protein